MCLLWIHFYIWFEVSVMEKRIYTPCELANRMASAQLEVLHRVVGAASRKLMRGEESGDFLGINPLSKKKKKRVRFPL